MTGGRTWRGGEALAFIGGQGGGRDMPHAASGREGGLHDPARREGSVREGLNDLARLEIHAGPTARRPWQRVNNDGRKVPGGTPPGQRKWEEPRGPCATRWRKPWPLWRWRGRQGGRADAEQGGCGSLATPPTAARDGLRGRHEVAVHAERGTDEGAHRNLNQGGSVEVQNCTATDTKPTLSALGLKRRPGW